MEDKQIILKEDDIKNRIYSIRGLHVMLDEDLAELYKVKTKRLNEQVKRNIGRFPLEFMFKLTDSEFDSLRSQIATSSEGSLRSQTVTLEKGRGVHRKYLPYVFTEQGVAMLSGVLKSDTAVRISIQIMTAFVAMRRFISSNAQIFQRLDNIEQKQIGYDKKFEQIFDAIESKELKPEKGIFFDGQIFDSDKYNSQYPIIEVKEFKQSHDRFLIIDNQKNLEFGFLDDRSVPFSSESGFQTLRHKEVYHFGASLKDLGKKWFAFSKFDKEVFNLMERLGLK